MSSDCLVVFSLLDVALIEGIAAWSRIFPEGIVCRRIDRQLLRGGRSAVGAVGAEVVVELVDAHCLAAGAVPDGLHLVAFPILLRFKLNKRL